MRLGTDWMGTDMVAVGLLTVSQGVPLVIRESPHSAPNPILWIAGMGLAHVIMVITTGLVHCLALVVMIKHRASASQMPQDSISHMVTCSVVLFFPISCPPCSPLFNLPLSLSLPQKIITFSLLVAAVLQQYPNSVFLTPLPRQSHP